MGESMDRLEVNAADQAVIIEANIRQINGSIYNEVIKKRVADRVEDKQMADAAKTALEKLERMKDEYTTILNDLSKARE
jgi:hypothetical protein